MIWKKKKRMQQTSPLGEASEAKTSSGAAAFAKKKLEMACPAGCRAGSGRRAGRGRRQQGRCEP